MKILVFIWRDITHPQAGGSELFVHEITKRWVKAGHKVTFLCGAYKGSEPYSNIDGIEIIRRGGKASLYFWALSMYITKLKKKKFDVIIDVENGIPFFTPLFVSCPKIAVLYHIHKEIFFRELPFYIAWLPYFLETVAMPILYRKTKFITISDSSRTEMVRYGFREDNIRVIYPGVDSEKYRPTTSSYRPSTFNIVFLGRLKKYKGIDVLVKAMKLVVKEIPEVRLIVVGRGDRGEELKNLVRTLHLENNIEFYGFVSENKKIEILQMANVAICPSFKEGWGITVIEANACGVPVIASDVSGLRDSVVNRKTGFLTPYGDSEGIAKKIILLSKNRKLSDELSKNAIEWSRRFSWDESSKNSLGLLIEVYENNFKDSKAFHGNKSRLEDASSFLSSKGKTSNFFKHSPTIL